MDYPGHIGIVVELDAGHDRLRPQPFGDVSLHEQYWVRNHAGSVAQHPADEIGGLPSPTL